MPKKIIQDIYVVKKSIRNIHKDDSFRELPVKTLGISEVAEQENKSFKSKLESKDLNRDENTLQKVAARRDFAKSHFADLLKKHEEDEDEVLEDIGLHKNHVSKDSLIWLWVICIISVATLLFFLSSMFSTATLTITPKVESITLNDIFNITSQKNVDGLHYEIMTLTATSTNTLTTDGEEYVERKAIGKATIFNNSGTASQRLITNTRLETKEGLTYRIRQSVEVPGIKTINGVKTPGSVEVEIIADMPGEKYNMKASDLKGDFTIPGFKGSPKYTTFYARLSPDTDIVGGFIGNVKKVTDEKLAAGRTELKDALQADLIKQIYSKKPDGYTLFNNNYYIQFTDIPNNPADKEYVIAESANIYSVVFKNEELFNYIAKNKIKDLKDSKVDILWGDNIAVSISGSTEKPWTENSLKAKFNGPADVVWRYDSQGILNSIAGQDKSVINGIIDDNKDSISEILSNIRPLWKNTFPEDIEKIKIVDSIRDKVSK